MDFLKSQISRIQSQLNGLTASQKMLTGSLIVIMVMTMMWWSRWAAQPEMQPVLNSLTPEQVGPIEANLDSRGIPYKFEGNRLYVPADRQMEVLGELSYGKVLPTNFDAPFDDMLKQTTWLDSPDKSASMMQEAKNRVIGQVISSYPGVLNAEVLIDPKTDVKLDGDSTQPTGSVSITTDHMHKADVRQLAEAAADFACGATPGLTRDNVRVIVDARVVQLDSQDDDSAGGNELVDLQQAQENMYRQKIASTLHYIDDVTIAVQVDINGTSMIDTSHDIDPKKVLSQPRQTEESSDETNTPTQAGEPGAVPNEGMNLPSTVLASNTATSSTSTEKDEMENDHFTEDKVVKQGRGEPTLKSASIGIPRSWFVKQFHLETGTSDNTGLDKFVTDQCAIIRKQVSGETGLEDADSIVVAEYLDTPSAEPTALATGSASTTMGLLTSHAKEVGVSVLAVMSLFMMSMMVRKGTPVPVLAAPTPQTAENPTLRTLETIIGQAQEGNSALDGMELDENAVKAQSMLDQVQQMVQNDPEAAANLVKRWLNRT